MGAGGYNEIANKAFAASKLPLKIENTRLIPPIYINLIPSINPDVE